MAQWCTFSKHPNAQGFEDFFGFCGGHWNNYFNTHLEHNGETVLTEGFITDVLTDAAIEFITRNKDRPFLCYVPYNAPHSPWQVPEEYYQKYDEAPGRTIEDIYFEKKKNKSIPKDMVSDLRDNLADLAEEIDRCRRRRDPVYWFVKRDERHLQRCAEWRKVGA